ADRQEQAVLLFRYGNPAPAFSDGGFPDQQQREFDLANVDRLRSSGNDGTVRGGQRDSSAFVRPSGSQREPAALFPEARLSPERSEFAQRQSQLFEVAVDQWNPDGTGFHQRSRSGNQRRRFGARPDGQAAMDLRAERDDRQ